MSTESTCSNEEDDHDAHLDDINRNSWTNMTRVIGFVTRTLTEIKSLENDPIKFKSRDLCCSPVIRGKPMALNSNPFPFASPRRLHNV